MRTGTAEAVVRAEENARESVPECRTRRLSPADFPGCRLVPMTYGDYAASERRFALWDAGSETAVEAREAMGRIHSRAASRLWDLIARIDRARGAPCHLFGPVDLRMRGPLGSLPGVMQPDACVYIDAARAARIEADSDRPDWIRVEKGELPDVILEVDHTTDSRRGKVPRYERWGAPELWVEVPDPFTYSRPPGLRPGLSIFLLEEGRFREARVSRAFPGWRAEEIHRGLNEIVMSEATIRAVERVGRALAERYGTSPEDDSQQRRFADGVREAMRMEVRIEERLGFLDAILRTRKTGRNHAFRRRLTAGDLRLLADMPEESFYRTAQLARSEEDFLRRLREASSSDS